MVRNAQEKMAKNKAQRQVNRAINKQIRQAKKDFRKKNREINKKVRQLNRNGVRYAQVDVNTDVMATAINAPYDISQICYNSETQRYHNLNDGYKMITNKQAKEIINKYHGDLYNKQDIIKYFVGGANDRVQGYAGAASTIVGNLLKYANEKRIKDPKQLEAKAKYDRMMLDYL